ncbi:MAG TPA: D-alanyl-D-alanine carboxypeptidase [Caulobacteraceae bacterium]
MFKTARRLVLVAVGVSALIGIGAPAAASAQSPYLRVAMDEPKYTAIVMDARTGEVLYEKRSDNLRYPASVTKIMTLYLTFQALASGRLHLNDLIEVSPLAAAQSPTKLGLRAGETITVNDAMHAMAVHSANDMAVAMAERIGGTEANFAAMMTIKARQLGMTNTRYVNANGLPDSRQITTARDLAILTRAVLRDYPQYYNFFSQEQFTYRGKTYFNTNHLLGKMPGVDGLKTGFTNAAGFNLAASAVRNGHRLIAVVMGGSSGAVRNANVENLLLTGFDVLERRDRGEKILVAQNLFEPGTVTEGRFGAPQAQENDESNDPIDVVLTRGAAGPQSMTVSSSMSGARPMLMADLGRRNAVSPVTFHRPAPREARNWWVQVGAFRSHREAKAQVESVSHRFGRIFDEAQATVDRGGRTYQARFSGLSESAAREACSSVRSQRIPCAAHGPA